MTPELGKIYHGDCLEIMKTWPDKCVDIVVTSPPYNTMGKRIPEKPTGMHKQNGWLKKASAIGYSDDMEEVDYQSWLREVVAQCLRLAKGLVWVNHKIRYRDGEGIHPARFLDFPFYSEIVWDRGGSMALNCRKFAPSHESIWGFGKPHYWDDGLNTKMSVWRVAPQKAADHPCPYPVDLIAPLIVSSCPPGGVVLDPFFGSGTSGATAEAHNRNFVGIEINSSYIPSAQKRIDAEKSQGRMF